MAAPADERTWGVTNCVTWMHRDEHRTSYKGLMTSTVFDVLPLWAPGFSTSRRIHKALLGVRTRFSIC
jgi:hypothetical protein